MSVLDQGATGTHASGAPPSVSSQADGNLFCDPHHAIPLVLFLEDDSRWLQQIERDLLCLQPSWSWRRVESTGRALSAFTSYTRGAVVVHARTPDIHSFVKTLEKTFPQIIRVARCDMRDRAGLSAWHDGLAILVPEEEGAAALATILDRAWRLQSWMADPAIKQLLPLLRKLPTAPKLHAQITQELNSPNTSMDQVARLISQDPVMAAKLLQVVNSAFFGLAYSITDPGQAVLFLGTERTRSLILVAGIFSQFDDQRCPGTFPATIWDHSLQVASYARAVALMETKEAKLADAAFTAGLLHDIGKLILAGNLPDSFRAVRQFQEQNRCSFEHAEFEILRTTHAELGSCLLGTWGLPLPMLEAIRWHHQPEEARDADFSLLTAVHVANAFAKERASDSGSPLFFSTISLPYLTRLGLAQRRNRWRRVCGLPTRPEDDSLEERQQRRQEAKENY